MNLLGLDSSLNGTGCCILDSSNSIIHLTTFTEGKSSRGCTRLIILKNKLLSIVQDFKVEFIFMEGYSYGSHGKTFEIGELCGIYKVLLHELNIPTIIVPPTTLKMYATGKGNAPKNIMLEQTFKKFQVGSEILKDDNQVDAYCLARFGADFLEFKKGEQCSRKFSSIELKSFSKIEY
jgi:crossover junction endodeoxyribonuclease RuvC